MDSVDDAGIEVTFHSGLVFAKLAAPCLGYRVNGRVNGFISSTDVKGRERGVNIGKGDVLVE